MASLNRVSLDTDVILLRKVFAFDDNNRAVVPNRLIFTGVDGQASFTDVSSVLNATVLPPTTPGALGTLPTIFADIYTKLYDLSGDIAAGGVTWSAYNANNTVLRALIRDASAAFVAPLAAEAAQTDASFNDVNAKIQAIVGSSIGAPWAAIMDISGRVAVLATDTSNLIVYTRDLSANTASSLQQLHTQMTDLSAATAKYFTDTSGNLYSVLYSVDAKLNALREEMQAQDFSGNMTFNGKVTMTQPLIIDVSGTRTAPAIQFSRPEENEQLESATGIYHPADGVLSISVNGANTVNFGETSTRFLRRAELQVPQTDMSAAAPGIHLIYGNGGASGVGLFRYETELHLAAGSIDAAKFTGTSATINSKLIVNVSGTPGQPAITFGSPLDDGSQDADTGLFHPAAGQIGIACNGVTAASFTSAGPIFTNDLYEYTFPGEGTLMNISAAPNANKVGWPSGTYVSGLIPYVPIPVIDPLWLATVNKYLARLSGGTSDTTRTLWSCPKSGLWQITLNCYDDTRRADHLVIGNITKLQPICMNKSSAIVYISADDQLLITGNYYDNDAGYSVKGIVRMFLIMPTSITMPNFPDPSLLT